MYNLNHHLHFIGIGGVGMAGIAEVLLNLGYRVSGSDLRKNQLASGLEAKGARVFVGHDSANLPRDATVVVVSSAVPASNPELLRAQELGIPVIPRAEMLAELMRMKYGIAVAGSHGKTTTTSMTASVLCTAGLDPTVIVGGRILSEQSGASTGMGQYLVAEADESDGSFCLLRPAIAVVTNVDREHLSYYGSFGALEESFFTFMASVPFYGLVVACGDDPIVKTLIPRLKRRVLTYGLSAEHDLSASELVAQGPSTHFTLNVGGKEVRRCCLPLSGAHMVSNALAAIGVGIELGVFPEEAAAALEDFPGVSRRCERVAEAGGVLVLDDYAHHPTEISATLRAIKASWLQHQGEKYGVSEPGRLIAIFQPHRFSRTRELFSEFVTCFGAADRVIIGDIYAAGEEALGGVHSASLAQSIQHEDVSYCAELELCFPELLSVVKPGDIVIGLGAGSISQMIRKFGRELEESRG